MFRLPDLNHTGPHETALESIATNPVDGPQAHATSRAAFRALHGPRLHGFALVLAMGERQWAAQAAVHALAEADPRLAELRHPERAAAWLRQRVVKRLQRPMLPPSLSSAERFRALSELGVRHATMIGLQPLSVPERAALVASDVERLSQLDVEQILGRGRNGSRRLLHAARRRFLAAVANEMPDAGEVPGPMARRVEWVSAQAVGPSRAR